MQTINTALFSCDQKFKTQTPYINVLEKADKINMMLIPD